MWNAIHKRAHILILISVFDTMLNKRKAARMITAIVIEQFWKNYLLLVEEEEEE